MRQCLKYIEKTFHKIEYGIFKSKTNKSFHVNIEFYFYPKNIDDFNYKQFQVELRRYIILSLPHEIKRHIYISNFPDTPLFISNPNNKLPIYSDIEITCWGTELIPKLNDKLANIINMIGDNFDKFAFENKYVNFSK